MVKCISTEYRLTKTKVITTTNECKGTYQKKPIRNRGENRRENPGDQDAICVCFASEWLRGCRDEIPNCFSLSIGNCSIKQIQDLLLAERKRYLEFCGGNSYWSRFTSDHASSNSWSSRNATKCNAIPPPKGWCKSFLLVNACAVFYSVCESTFLRSTLRDSKRYVEIFCAIYNGLIKSIYDSVP